MSVAELDETPRRRIGDDVVQVHAALRTLILDCKLEPGQRVTQAELSRLTGAGRTPLREALRMLQQEGLVKSELNKRVTIASLDLDEVDCTYAYRVSLESVAVRLSAPRMTAEDLAELDRLMDEMAAALAHLDRDEFEVPHRRFHKLLVSHVKEVARERMALDADVSERVRRFLMHEDVSTMAVADGEHREILNACHQGDGDKAAQLLAKHLARSAFYVTEHLDPTYDAALTRTALQTVVGASPPPADPVDGERAPEVL